MIIIMFIFTVAELTISPTGMALTTRLAPEAYKVNMMALYWTSLAMGTAFAGWCAQTLFVFVRLYYERDMLLDPKENTRR